MRLHFDRTRARDVLADVRLTWLGLHNDMGILEVPLAVLWLVAVLASVPVRIANCVRVKV